MRARVATGVVVVVVVCGLLCMLPGGGVLGAVSSTQVTAASYLGLATHEGASVAVAYSKAGKVYGLPYSSSSGVGFDTSAVEIADLTSIVSESANEKGLLGIALHPEFPTNGRVFVVHSCVDGACTMTCPSDPCPSGGWSSTCSGGVCSGVEGVQTLDEYVLSPRVWPLGASPSFTKVKTLLRVRQPFGNHNGGQILFRPDGEGCDSAAGCYLYYMLGDGGSGSDPFRLGQDMSSLLGKVLRLGVDGVNYSVPVDNPFPSVAPLVYAYGMRNPWRCSFDNVTLVCGDVGQDTREEVTLVTRGTNHGWPRWEGTLLWQASVSLAPDGPLVEPVLEYTHADVNPARGWASITGGHVLKDTEAFPSMCSHYVYADYVTGPRAAFVNGTGAYINDSVLELVPTDGVIVAGVFEVQLVANGRVLYYLAQNGVFKLTDDINDVTSTCSAQAEGPATTTSGPSTSSVAAHGSTSDSESATKIQAVAFVMVGVGMLAAVLIGGIAMWRARTFVSADA